MDEQRSSQAAPNGDKREWVTPELIIEEVKSVTQGGGRVPVAGREDVEGSYYTSA